MERETREQGPTPALDSETEDYVAFRVFQKALRLFAFPATVVIGVGGFFGFDLWRQVTSVRDQLLRDILPQAMARVDSLKRMQQELEALIAVQGGQLARQNEMSSSQLGELIRQAGDLARSIERLEASRGRVEEIVASTAVRDSQLDTLRAQMESGLQSLGRDREQVAASRAAIDSTMSFIERRVFGSWSFVVHEKQRTDLAPLPLSVRMTTIRDGVLRDFEVSSNGVVIHGASDFPVGRSRCVADRVGPEDAVWYRLTPSYIVELFFGADIAGLQVERMDDEAQCRRGLNGGSDG